MRHIIYLFTITFFITSCSTLNKQECCVNYEKDFSTRRVVLCGGVSQTVGLREKASSMLNAQVRCGKPVYIKGLSEAIPMTTTSTAIGLLLYALNHRIQKEDKKITNKEKTDLYKITEEIEDLVNKLKLDGIDSVFILHDLYSIEETKQIKEKVKQIIDNVKKGV